MPRRSQPVKLTPTPKGRWRWIGTRTILFDPDVRFPQATTYKVEIPAGTKTRDRRRAQGRARRSRSRRRRRRSSASYPNGGAAAPRRADVRRCSIRRSIRRRCSRSVAGHGRTATPVAIELRRRDEIAKDKHARARSSTARRRPSRTAAGSRSARPSRSRRTPRSTSRSPRARRRPRARTRPTTTQRFAFRTYPPLQIDELECGWGGECRPGMPFSIRVQQPARRRQVRRRAARDHAGDPERQDRRRAATSIVDRRADRRRARRTRSSSRTALRDEFGQTLGKDDDADVHTSAIAQPTFFGPQGMVVLDPGGEAADARLLHDELRAAQGAALPGRAERLRRVRALHAQPVEPRSPAARCRARRCSTSSIATTAGTNELVETHVDLAPALATAGSATSIAIVEPYPWTESYEPPRMIAWVQATKLGDRRVRRRRQPRRVRDRARHRQAGGGRRRSRSGRSASRRRPTTRASRRSRSATRSLKGAHYLVAKRGDDVAFVTDDDGWWNEYGSWVKQRAQQRSSPGTSSTIARCTSRARRSRSRAGCARSTTARTATSAASAARSSASTYKVIDSRGNQIAHGLGAGVSAVGGFDTKFTLPKTPNLGYAHVEFETQGRLRRAATRTASRSRSSAGPSSRSARRRARGRSSSAAAATSRSTRSTTRGGPLPGAPVDLVRDARRPRLHAAEPRRLHVRRVGAVVGLSRLVRRRRRRGYKPPKTWTLARQDRRDRRARRCTSTSCRSTRRCRCRSPRTRASPTSTARPGRASAALIVHPSSLYVGAQDEAAVRREGHSRSTST